MEWRYMNDAGWFSGIPMEEEGYPDSVAITSAGEQGRRRILAIRTVQDGEDWQDTVRRYADDRGGAA